MLRFWLNYGSFFLKHAIKKRLAGLQCARNLMNDSNTQLTYSIELSPYEATIKDIDTAPSTVNFFAITWDARKHKPGSYDVPPLTLATHIKNEKKNVLFHLNCDLLRTTYLKHLLSLLQDRGICSLFVTLGAQYDPALSDFSSSIRLIDFIRHTYGGYFSIGVPGFLNINEKTIANLKQKVDTGAEFVITETVFDYRVYKKFIDTCKNNDINVPIVPSMFVCDTYQQFYDFAKATKFKIPLNMLHYLSNKDIDLTKKTIQKVAENFRNPENGVQHVHFVTINNDLYTAFNFVQKEKIYA